MLLLILIIQAVASEVVVGKPVLYSKSFKKKKMRELLKLYTEFLKKAWKSSV